MAATAVAICQGGATAAAYSEAYSVAVSKNSEGCSVLTEAFARAYAQCGPQGASAWAESGTTVEVLNDCARSNTPIFVATPGPTAPAAPGQPPPIGVPTGIPFPFYPFPPIVFTPIQIPGFPPLPPLPPVGGTPP